MPLESLINQGKTIYQNIQNVDQISLLTSPGNLQPWNGLNFDDFVTSYKAMIEDIDLMYESGILDTSTFNIVNAVYSTINAVHQHINAYITQKNQNTFQNMISSIENLRTNLQSMGLRNMGILSQRLEERSKLIDDELNKALTANKEINSLKENVSKLIEPAVAGSLSKSFSDRKVALHSNQRRWFWSSVITASVSIIVTGIIVWSIVGVFSAAPVLKAIESNKNGIDGVIWITIVLRIGVLVPIYSIFVFSFMQYRNERNLEEEYAHKAAVATSLPNYGGLAVDDVVRDQILSEASKVIFVSPITKNKQKEGDPKGVDLGQLSSLFENITKMIPKSG